MGMMPTVEIVLSSTEAGTANTEQQKPLTAAELWAKKRQDAIAKAAKLRAERQENTLGMGSDTFLDRLGAAEKRDEAKSSMQSSSGAFGDPPPRSNTPPPKKMALPKVKIKKTLKIAATSPSSPLKKRRAAAAAAKAEKDNAHQAKRQESRASALDPGRDMQQYGFEPVGPIAAGAFSTILRARETATGREVAVKTFDSAKCGKAALLGQARDAELAVLRFLAETAAAKAGRSAGEGSSSHGSPMSVSDNGSEDKATGDGGSSSGGTSGKSTVGSCASHAGFHPNIANMLAEHHGTLAIHCVLEYCTGGTLQRHLQLLQKNRAATQTRAQAGLAAGDAQAVGMPEVQGAQVIWQVAAALEHLHGLEIAHRDVKPGNILFDGPLGAAEPVMQVKLCDFGFATRCGKRLLKKQVGTPSYVAPELTVPPDSHDGYRGRPVDMWALGVVLYETLHGKPAFYGSNMEQLETRIRAGSHEPFSKEMSSGPRALFQGMLKLAAKERLTAKQALKHPWLANARKLGEQMRQQQGMTEMIEGRAKPEPNSANARVGRWLQDAESEHAPVSVS